MRSGMVIGLLLIGTGRLAAQDMPLSQILIEGENWRKLDGVYRGITWFAREMDGTVWADLGANDGAVIIRPDGAVEKRPVRIGPISGYQGSTGGFSYGVDHAKKGLWIWGQQGGPRPLEAAGPATPSALSFSPDRGTMVVADSAGKYLWAFRIEKDGRLSFGAPYYPLRVRSGKNGVGATALTVDGAGRVYAATELGVQVFDPTGRLSGVLLPPGLGAATAMRFGGARSDLLVAAWGESIFVRQLKATGVAP
jgi:hypothetical protein